MHRQNDRTRVIKLGDYMEKKALIAMSGGVDSSVAAYLMKEKNQMIIGIISAVKR